MIEIYDTPINAGDGRNRREMERNASILLIAKVFGNDARLDHDNEGRPLVEGCDFEGMISISHCADRCLLAVTREKDVSIGIDTETWREQLRRVAPRFMIPAEVAVYDSPALLLLAWTTKEAVYKAARVPGLAFQEILLPIPAPDGKDFTVTARDIKFKATSVALSPLRATTTAEKQLKCLLSANF